MYGNRASRKQKQKKMKETEVLGKSKDFTLLTIGWIIKFMKKKYSWIQIPVFYTDPV